MRMMNTKEIISTSLCCILLISSCFLLITVSASSLEQHKPIDSRIKDFLKITSNEQLVYSTFVGGSADEHTDAIVLDSKGNKIITGWTTSTDFPTTHNAYDNTLNGTANVFVSKLSADGSVILNSTFLGGTEDNFPENWWEGVSITLDSSNNIIIAGHTRSSDFPTTTGANDTSHNGDVDVFVAKLSADLSELHFCTFIGGTGNDSLNKVTQDSLGNIVVLGKTDSTDFPIRDAFDSTHNGKNDIYITTLSADGSEILYSTYIGGLEGDAPFDIAFYDDHAYVVGWTFSENFPTTLNAFQSVKDGGIDAFLTIIPLNGSEPSYSTFIGGGANEGALCLTLDPDGNAVLAGFTASTNFDTTPNSYDTSYAGSLDGFVCGFSTTFELLFSTYFGASGEEVITTSICLDSSRNIYITSMTSSVAFPTTQGAYDNIYNGGTIVKIHDGSTIVGDVFLSKFSPNCSELLYSTFIGGSSAEESRGIVLEDENRISITGWTGSDTFPITSGAFDESYNGGNPYNMGGDVFVLTMDFSSSPEITTTEQTTTTIQTTTSDPTTTNSSVQGTQTPGFTFSIALPVLTLISAALYLCRKKKN